MLKNVKRMNKTGNRNEPPTTTATKKRKVKMWSEKKIQDE